MEDLEDRARHFLADLPSIFLPLRSSNTWIAPGSFDSHRYIFQYSSNRRILDTLVVKTLSRFLVRYNFWIKFLHMEQVVIRNF